MEQEKMGYVLKEDENIGTIKIADDVVARIAGDNPPAVRYADGGLTVKVRPSPELSDLLVDSFKGRL